MHVSESLLYKETGRLLPLQILKVHSKNITHTHTRTYISTPPNDKWKLGSFLWGFDNGLWHSEAFFFLLTASITHYTIKTPCFSSPVTDSSSVWLHQRTERELASQMQCFISITENEQSPKEVPSLWSLGLCHSTTDGRQRTKDPVTVHALILFWCCYYR